MGIHVPNQLRLRNSQHPANKHELVNFKCILAIDSTYAGYAEVGAEIKHICYSWRLKDLSLILILIRANLYSYIIT